MTDTAAVWWCPGSLWEPAGKEMNKTDVNDGGKLLLNNLLEVIKTCLTFLVSCGRMTPSSHILPEEKNAELSSSSLLFRVSTCFFSSSSSSSSWGSREPAWPGAVRDTLALGHRKRKLGSKARPHWRQNRRVEWKCLTKKKRFTQHVKTNLAHHGKAVGAVATTNHNSDLGHRRARYRWHHRSLSFNAVTVHLCLEKKQTKYSSKILKGYLTRLKINLIHEWFLLLLFCFKI